MPKIITAVLILYIILLTNCIRKNTAPDQPAIIGSPTNGLINISYNFTASTIDPDGDSVSYQFDWGDGTQSSWSDFKISGASVTMTKSWSQTGTYLVKAIAKDSKQALSNWSDEFVVTISTNHTPNIPSAPSGPTNGIISHLYNFTASTIDPDGDSISYQFDWGYSDTSIWSAFIPNNNSITITNSWSDTGTYSIRVRAKDVKNAISNWSNEHNIYIITTTNHSPNIPSIPSGFSNGYINTLYNFTTSTTDPDDDSISYQFDWGDGTQSDWSAFRSSGISILMAKQWSQAGVYSVKARAQDIEGAVSDWSDGHSITITANNPPDIPAIPSGPSSGYPDTLYNFTTSTTDPENDSVAYQFDWGNGITSNWSNFIPSSVLITMTYSWVDTGSYSIRARAKDTKGAMSDWSAGHSIHIIMTTNHSPNIPSVPNGFSNGYTNILYNFTTSTSDPDGDSVSYQFDWGDGTQSEWSVLRPSGSSIMMSNSWSQAGVYLVKARAKDIEGALSDWSFGHTITISSNSPPNIPSTPSGPSTGSVNLLYNFTTSTSDPENDSVSYQFDWGNGVISTWSSFVPSGITMTMSNTWIDSGTYLVKARAKDTRGAISNWSAGHSINIVTIINHPPNTPSTPSGPSSGAINTVYNFTTSTIDPDNDSISYQFDWGNGIISHWSNFVANGTPVTMMQAWADSGIYLIKARAKDPMGATSDWSSAHTIVITTTDTSFPRQVVATIPVGDGPVGVDALPNGNYVYVTNAYGDNVSVIRTSDNMVIRTISVGDDPLSATVSPNGNYIYVTNRFSDDVYVIRTSDNTVVAIVPVGGWPSASAVTPNGNFVYTANWQTDDVSVIRTSDNTVIAAIQVNDGPQGICILPNGNYVYVSNLGSNNVSVIRTSDNTIVTTIPVGAGPRGIVALPNGNYVYCANETGNTISVIRTSDNTVVATFSVSSGPSRMCVLPGGQYIYVSQLNSTTVAAIRSSDNTVVATIPVGQSPQAVKSLPNGNFLYVANRDSDNVMVIGR